MKYHSDLDEFFGSASRLDQNTCSLLSRLVTTGSLSRMLTDILQHPQRLASVAERSYTHFNSFDKIVLLSDESGKELRLHLWQPSERRWHKENVHDHKWDFCTFLISGGYDFEVFDVAQSGMSAFEFRYSTREHKSRYTLPYRGPVFLKRTVQGSRKAGDGYYLTHDTLHRITPKAHQPTMTVLIRGGDKRRFARVFTEDRSVVPSIIESTPFTPDSLGEKIGQAVQILRAAHARLPLAPASESVGR